MGWKRLFHLEDSARRAERDVDDELRFHIEERVDELVARGMSEVEARAEVLSAFGDVERIRSTCTEIDGRRREKRQRRERLASIGQDLRFALRTLRRSPAFTLVALVTLALGIGANTAIFSVVHGVLLRPLPYQDGGELVLLRHGEPRAGVSEMNFSAVEIRDYREGAETLDGVVEYHSMWFNLLGREEPERVLTGVVSANFFRVLGVQPLLGRGFRPGEDEPGAEPVLVLSYDYWQRSHGGDPGVVGRSFEMNDRVHTVVGVLPPVPQFPRDNDVYMPVSACPFRSGENARTVRTWRMMGNVFARLNDGVSLEQARADVTTVADRLQQDYPDVYERGSGYEARLEPLQEALTRRARPTFLLLLAMAGLVLLLACANVANLMLTRVVRREREFAVRAALGAGRGRLLRQLLTESTLLALVGGGLGLLLAWAGMDVLVEFAARFTPRAAEVGLDGTVLAFTLVLSLGTGFLFGALPALSPREDLTTPLKRGAGRGGTGASGRLRGTLIVVQVAISFVLLIGAGLMVRSLIELQRVDPGFTLKNVVAMEVDLDWSTYGPGPERLAFVESLLPQVRQLPGVSSVAVAQTFPLDPGGGFDLALQIEGRAVEEGDVRPRADVRIVSPGYFRTLGIPLLRGRGFSDRDHADAPAVAIVNRSMARHYWPGESPIGQRVSGNGGESWVTVVGVVGDVRQALESAALDEIYVPYAQAPTRGIEVLVRTAGHPVLLRRELARSVYEIDPDQPVAGVRTLEQVRGGALASPRLTAVLLALFAGLALVITVAGIIGVVGFTVSRRTQEIGIRMALGAERGRVQRMVLAQGLGFVIAGLAIGAIGALALTRLMSGLLFRVEPTDPSTYVVVSLILVAAALFAALPPARRATSIDPVLALRAE